MPSSNAEVAASFQNHPLYPDFIQVKNKLKAIGSICWIAGGAVRDILLDRQVSDFDLVTDATTEQLTNLFPEAILVGAQFGVVKLNLKTLGSFDLATFRRESDYIDGRRPSSVDYATPEEDAQRRDFTINSLFWDDQNGAVIDYQQGLPDLQRQIIKCVGIPAVRFQEDHLRILRLLRFSVQLQFSIEELTLQAATARIKSLEKISGERIWSEILKMAPFVHWSHFFTNDFNRLVIQSLFPVQIENSILPVHQVQLDRADQSDSAPQIKLFYFLLLFVKSEDVLLKLLKNRLRLSRLEIDTFSSIQFCLKNLNLLSVNEWVYEIEKKPQVGDVLKFVADLDLVLVYPEIRQKLVQLPAKIIDGHDLKNRVSPVDTAKVLKKIRLLQYEQPYLSKSEILEYLSQNKIISI